MTEEVRGVPVPELEPEPVPDLPPRPADPRGIILEKEERLEAENVQLKVMLKLAEREKAIIKLKSIDAELGGLSVEVRRLQAALTDKYGIDFTRHAIEPGTGCIVNGAHVGQVLDAVNGNNGNG